MELLPFLGTDTLVGVGGDRRRSSWESSGVGLKAMHHYPPELQHSTDQTRIFTLSVGTSDLLVQI